MSHVRKIVFIAIFGALATVVMSFKFPALFVAPGFYKLEFSEIICLIGGYMLGAPAAIAIEAIKVLLNLLIDGTTTAYVGEFANFLMGCALVVPATLVFRHSRTIKSAIVGAVVGVVSLAVVSCLLNAYVLIPMYARLFIKGDMPESDKVAAIVGAGTAIFPQVKDLSGFVLTCVLLFNLLKGVASAVAGVAVFHLVPKKFREM